MSCPAKRLLDVSRLVKANIYFGLLDFYSHDSSVLNKTAFMLDFKTETYVRRNVCRFCDFGENSIFRKDKTLGLIKSDSLISNFFVVVYVLLRKHFFKFNHFVHVIFDMVDKVNKLLNFLIT